ncbi:MAG: DUF3857 domain-containing transglutaminase family protein [Pseudomonadota bacterium]
MRRQDSLVHLTQDGARSYQNQMFRLLQPQALQVGNIAITWNPAAGPAYIHALRIHRGGRVIEVLENTDFEVLRREDQLEQAMLTGQLTASLRVPDLRVGDDLELAFSVPLHDPTLQDLSHGILFLGASPPSGRFRLQLSWTPGQEPTVKMTDELSAIAQKGDRKLTLDFDNPSVISPPRDAPPRYSWARVLEFSDFADWEAVSRRFYPLFEKASTLSPQSALREEARFIAQDHAGKLAQAQAALKLVQQQVRYIYIGLNGGNYTPASADETWERRYGDCKGKTAMLLALLRELGIEAEAVLVANNQASDGYAQRLPNPALFDHVLVRARIDGEEYWLDGTLPAVIEARSRPFFPYQSVLALTAEGEPLDRLPDEPLDLPQIMTVFDIDASEGFDAPGRLTQVSISRGQAALEQYYSFSSVTAGQLEAALRNQLVGSPGWDSVETVAFRFDRETQASVLTISGTGPVDWEDEGDGAYDLALPGGGFSPPNRRQRSGDAAPDVPFWQAPQYSCFATTVRLPRETELDKWGFNSVFDTMLYGRVYYRMMELRDDRSLRLVRGSRVERIEISPERAQRDNRRLDRFDNSKAVLSYDPAGVGEPWGTLRPVPAADEIDWAGPNVPCLPSDILDS